MKTYTNGQRKGMMYGGAAKTKPMMNGGMATKKTPQESTSGGHDDIYTGSAEHDAKQHDAEAYDEDGRRW